MTEPGVGINGPKLWQFNVTILMVTAGGAGAAGCGIPAKVAGTACITQRLKAASNPFCCFADDKVWSFGKNMTRN